MPLTRLYYLTKPFLPVSLRVGMRRLYARQILKRCGNVWPIKDSNGAKPEGWPGWPEGRQFAFVLTHDVEGQRGFDRVKPLAEMEMELGFRSSFNFVPEGEYRVPIELRSWLTERGFEVGIHDLHHNGRLYESRKAFLRNAARINYYLREWNAVGFRSAFMLRNLNWIGDLDICYDASTFDTDPFEPQPDGADTIFPFWVPRPSLNSSRDRVVAERDSQRQLSTNNHPPSGYVELPYTLPQDSTMFLFLEEKSNEIWKKKLDWIAGKGGMALVNAHPDYFSFSGVVRNGEEFPARHYRDFLVYLKDRYAEAFWHPRPRELAEWYYEHHRRLSTAQDRYTNSSADSVSTPKRERLIGKRAAVLLYSEYPGDPRPRRAAEALTDAGMEVDVLCLRREGQKAKEIINGVSVLRLPWWLRRGGKLAYLFQYGRFLVASFAWLTLRSWVRRYDLVHVHNMPDVLVFAALLPKLQGARVMLDLHDPMPELMMDLYGLKSDHWLVRALRTFERWSIAFADLAITPNITFKNLFVSRSCHPEKMIIVMNSPRAEIFDPDRFGQERRPANGEFRIMHHGSVLYRHGIDLLVKAVSELRHKIPGVRLDIYGGRTPFLDQLLELSNELGIADIVHYHGDRPHFEMAEAILKCNVGVVPNRRSAFTEINFPTRLFEYLSMHRPVVAPSTQGIRDYFAPDQILLFEPSNVNDLASKILWVFEQPVKAQQFVERGIEVYRKNMWYGEKTRLLQHVSQLMNMLGLALLVT
jgi:glycosyltransferase involved in cell wall biosynthesis